MKKYKIKIKARDNKTGIFMIPIILIFVGTCLLNDAIHDFQYVGEPVVIQRILISFEAILSISP